MKIGLIGLPNAGKTTIFNALCGGHAKAENYPFTTIEPNIGAVNVPDVRLYNIASVYKPERVVPASVRILDVAGLVKGASNGEGLGNKFLNNIREVDSLVHVVRYFKDEEVPHNYGNIDPVRDIEIINTELMLSDLDVVERNLKGKKGDQSAQDIYKFLLKTEEYLKNGKMLNTVGLTTEELKIARQYGLLTIKPIIYVVNVDEDYVNKEVPGFPKNQTINICGKWESELQDLDIKTKSEFMADLGVKELGLDRLAKICYKSLNLVTFFSTESKEVRAWSIIKGSKVVKAAGKIHSDMEDGFIKAEVVPYDVLMKWKDPHKAKDHGEMLFEGKEYIVKDGDIVKFHFSK